MSNISPSRKCWKCKEIKELEEFYFRNKNKGIRNHTCKSCQRTLSSEWSKKNPERRQRTVRAWHEKQRRLNLARVHELKSSPCIDCGNTYPPWVMDFDHRDPITKIQAISHMTMAVKAMDKILEEIKKCDLVCSNCHRDRTYRQQHSRSNGKYQQKTQVEEWHAVLIHRAKERKERRAAIKRVRSLSAPES